MPSGLVGFDVDVLLPVLVNCQIEVVWVGGKVVADPSFVALLFSLFRSLASAATLNFDVEVRCSLNCIDRASVPPKDVLHPVLRFLPSLSNATLDIRGHLVAV